MAEGTCKLHTKVVSGREMSGVRRWWFVRRLTPMVGAPGGVLVARRRALAEMFAERDVR